MGAVALTSPAGWKIFRSPGDSASNSTGAAPTPPTLEAPPPPVSKLVCSTAEEMKSSEKASLEQAKPDLIHGGQPKAASSAPATLRPLPKTTAATRPRSFIATSRVKTFGKPAAPGPTQQQHPPAKASRPAEQTGLLRSLAGKKRLPRWLSRSSEAIEVSKPQLVSSSLSPASPTPLEPILLLGRAESAPGLSSSSHKEAGAAVPCVTFERKSESVIRTRSASISTAQLLEEAATKLMNSAAQAASAAAKQGNVLPPVKGKDTKAQVKTSVNIITRDAKLQNGLREVLNSKNNKSTPSLATAAAAAKPRPSDTPPHSISRKAVPKLPQDCDSDFLPQELPLKSEMLYPGISSSVHLSRDAPTLHNIVVSRASAEFDRPGCDSEADDLPSTAHTGARKEVLSVNAASVPVALKGKVDDLTKEVEAWKKSRLAQRASRQEQEQQRKIVRKVRVQEVEVCEQPGKMVEKMQGQAASSRGRASGDCSSSTPPVQSATPSKHRMSRSSNGSQRSRPPSAPLPSLPSTPKKQPHQRAPPQRKVSEAATQTSELAFIVTRKEQPSSTVHDCSAPTGDIVAPLIDLGTPCAAERQEALRPSPAPLPSHSPADETVTFISQEEASLDFGSLGPPTDSSCLPNSNAARLSSKHAAGVKAIGERAGEPVNAMPPVIDARHDPSVLKHPGQYVSSPALPSLKNARDQQALETQFWSLLAQVQARESGYADASATELNAEPAAGGETGASSTSTLSFAGIRHWRERVASEAGRLRKVQHGPTREASLAAPGEGEPPHLCRGVSHPLVLLQDAEEWDDFELPSAIFPPTSTLATRGSASQMTEAKVHMQLVEPPHVKDESIGLAPAKPSIPPIQVQTHDVSTASSSMLSWGTRSRRTLSEHEAQRLFGSLAAVPRAGEEWGVKNGAEAGLEEELDLPVGNKAAERGRKRRSRNTFGVASFEQREREDQLVAAATSRGASLTAPNTLTTTTTTTTATQSVISVTRSTSGPALQAPPAVAAVDTALAQQQTISASMCESTSTPKAQHISTIVNVAQDGQLQLALELVAHRIGIASEELERLQRDLHLIARAKGEVRKGEETGATAGMEAVAIEA